MYQTNSMLFNVVLCVFILCTAHNVRTCLLKRLKAMDTLFLMYHPLVLALYISLICVNIYITSSVPPCCLFVWEMWHVYLSWTNYIFVWKKSNLQTFQADDDHIWVNQWKGDHFLIHCLRESTCGFFKWVYGFKKKKQTGKYFIFSHAYMLLNAQNIEHLSWISVQMCAMTGVCWRVVQLIEKQCVGESNTAPVVWSAKAARVTTVVYLTWEAAKFGCDTELRHERKAKGESGDLYI